MQFIPIQSERIFAPGVLYSQINWSDFSEVMDRFEDRMCAWYINPAKHVRDNVHDNGFALVSSGCQILDALSQYVTGRSRSRGADFKNFVSTRIPEFGGVLSQQVQLDQRTVLAKFADALWSAFRNGILHQAHVPLVGAVDGSGVIVTEVGNATQYANGSPCLTVVIDPLLFINEVVRVYEEYLAELRNPDQQYDQTRRKFKKKFRSCFGITL
jgi:hypothetical protein